MNVWHCLHTALSNLRANKLRSFLTMLGVIIGVGAVIVMVAIVQGQSAFVTREFKRMGSDLIFVTFQPERKDLKKGPRRHSEIFMDDVRAIARQCDLVRNVAAETPFGFGTTAKFLDRESNVRAVGVQPAYEELRNVELAHGRFITVSDEARWAKVCIIGEKIRRDLFPDREPVGQDLQLASLNLTVVGVLRAKGRSLDGDADKQMFVPLSTVQKRLIGHEQVGTIFAQPKDPAQINAAMDQIWHLLMRRYDNLPGWRVDSQENILNSINRILAVFGFVLGAIAGLALLVGGIGIMNIMLVSVTERTREIGIRKAVGAKRRDILLQFLIESATVSGTGGVIGIALGAGFAYLVGFVTQFVPALAGPDNASPGLPVHLPVAVALGAFTFSAFIGIFFGIYPAIRASYLDPIEALRHE